MIKIDAALGVKIADILPKNLFQVGDCIIISGNGFVADGIEWITSGKASHVAIYIGGGEQFVIEARMHGIEKNSVNRLFKDVNHFVVRRIPGLTVEQAEKMKEKAYSFLGKHYDFRLFSSLGAYYLLKKIGITWNALLGNNKNEMICNELYRLCAEEAGYSFSNNPKSETPKTYLETDKLQTVFELSI